MLPLTSHPGLFSFHFYMFHGRAVRLKQGTHSFFLASNAYVEPGLMLPGHVLACREEVAEPLRRHVSATTFAFAEQFVFYLPYTLGVEPPHLGWACAEIEREMERKNAALLPAADSGTRRTWTQRTSP